MKNFDTNRLKTTESTPKTDNKFGKYKKKYFCNCNYVEIWHNWYLPWLLGLCDNKYFYDPRTQGKYTYCCCC